MSNIPPLAEAGRKGGNQEVKPEDFPKLDECHKVKMILDKDLLDFQCAEAIRAVCANCSEVTRESRVPSQKQ